MTDYCKRIGRQVRHFAVVVIVESKANRPMSTNAEFLKSKVSKSDFSPATMGPSVCMSNVATAGL